MKTWSLGILEAVDKEKINQHWMDDSDFCCAANSKNFLQWWP